MRRLTTFVAAACAFAVVLPARATEGDIVLQGEGISVVVGRAPLSVAILDARGTVLNTLGAAESATAALAVTAPEPGADVVVPAGLSFTLGAAPRAQFRASPWSGNGLAGARAGVRFAATSVSGVSGQGAETVLDLNTSAPGTTASLRIGFPAKEQVHFAFDAPGAAAAGITFHSPADERFYGFGERKDRVNQRGRVLNAYLEETNVSPANAQPVVDAVFDPRYTFPNGAQASYYPLPSFLSSRNYGMLVEGGAPTRYDMAASTPDAYTVEAEGSSLVVRVQTGADLREVIAGLTAVSGRPASVPEWSFMPWIDECAQLTEGDPSPLASTYNAGAAARARVVEQLDRVAQHDLTVGVMGVDGWQEVPDLDGLFEQAAAQNIRLASYINPFIGVRAPWFEKARALDVLVHDASGSPYVFINSFNSATGLVDFTAPNAKEFWREPIEHMLDLGFRAWMHDFGEEVQSDMYFASGETGATMHNAYPVAYAAITKSIVDEWVARHPGESVFFYMRTGWTGSVASTGGVFPGDETTDWGPGSGLPSEIPAMVNLAVSGITAFTPDIAGYIDVMGNPPDADLYTRWSQMGALSPGMRVHNSAQNPERYPWSYDVRTLDVWRKFSRLHANLAPYFARAAADAATTGLGIGRPLYLEDSATADVWLDTEYMLGDDLLVAPVLRPKSESREVYLPSGSNWIQQTVDDVGRLVPHGLPIVGGAVITAPAPFDQIPVFLRAGAVNPTA